ncbi:hypothetical protein SLEP1_g36564 [Rubroshorea leprosula]|uniref:Reverse transcriptase domain-containing protein n=1 Tax=Rubroshorea leprosula TaxID=152421 RepID=A0AAV5KS49_9ROSI|nr:hypothetical protein SLEP1_g36564 [Rubroshorea leprosula]
MQDPEEEAHREVMSQQTKGSGNRGELERQLDQIWVGDQELWVNIPRYDDEKKEEKKGRNGQTMTPKYQSRTYAKVLQGQGARTKEGVSKKESKVDQTRRHGRGVIRNNEDNGINESRKIWKEKGKGASWAGIEYNIKEEEYAWLEGCYVGTAHLVEMVRNLQEKFYMEGYFSCRVRAMGGKLVLLDCEDKEELKDLVEMAADWLGQRFEEVRPWKPNLVAQERFVWIRCHGAPLNAWGCEFFEKMGSSWGKFICLDDSTSNKRRFDIARFLISTPIMDTITVTRQVKVNGVLFNIKFKEEEFTNSFFSLKQDFIPSFHSDSEDHESWSLGTDLDAMEEGVEKTQEPGEVRSTDAGKEDDEVASGRGKKKKRADNIGRLDVTQEHGEEARRIEQIRKRKKRKSRSCKSLYSNAADAGVGNQRRNSQGRNQTQGKEGKVTPALILSSTSKIAGESIGDGGILNCNRLVERQRQEQLAEDIWEFAKSLGVVAENEQQVTQRIDEMEKRDKKEKTNMVMTEVTGIKEDDFDWVAKASNGRSGGLLSVWNSKVFRKNGVIEGENYLGVCGLWGEEDTVVYIINIYSPCLLMGKKALWEELQRLITSKGGKWCLAGDFNVVRKVEERAGSREITREMREFDDFILNTGLIDLPLAGRKYTWYNSNGQYMSRIDRFLMSEEWILNWSDVKQWGLSRSVSDHCPILLKNESIDWGPKPFKFFNAWLDQPGCKEIITEVWNSTKVMGWNGYILKEKLKRTKNKLKQWSRNAISEVDRKVKEAEKEIAAIDEKGEKGQLSPQDVEQRKNYFLELWKNIKIKESMWQQKSRKMWLKERDANTKYFHTCVKGRSRRNEILSIQIKGDQHTGVAKIKEKVAKYFEELFTEEKWKRPKLDGIRFNKISEADNDILTATFSEEEIKEAIWDCESSKSPGPDGFNFSFVKAMWEDIKVDIVGFVHKFHKQGKIVKGSHASFIVLIPKVENPPKIEEFKPISLIGVMYKILAKLLANRLGKVIHKVIGEQQMAFIRGRQLAEGVVIANEVINEAKRNKKKSFLFKVDFEKAYDKVCWSFINYMMLRMGFCEAWRSWIQECLRSSSVSVIVNGSPTRQFMVTKGIHQGDLLSPFLFLIVAEGLNGMVTAAVEKKLYKGVTVGSEEAMVSHLQFADDTIFFGEASEENIWAIKCIVRSFELVSGLKINYAKSQLMGVNLEEGWKEKMACRLYCKGEDLPFKYLGIPIGGNHRKLAMWQPLVESVKRKLAPWKGRHVSFGGRITLINSVLFSLPVFLMSVYLLPKGVKEMRKFNLALMGKWWGRLAKKEQGLWDKVIESKYGGRGGNWFEWVREGRGIGSLWWRDVCCLNYVDEECEGWLTEGFKLKLGEGKGVSFWWDNWGGEGSLANLFPRLYSLSTGKDKECCQMGYEENGTWKWNLKWKRALFDWEREEAAEVQRKVDGVQLYPGMPDAWKWEHSKEGNYSTKTAYRILAKEQNALGTLSTYKRIWNLTIPSKISAFNWQLVQDRIPTKSNLQRRGIINALGEENCVLCEREIEDAQHLFLKCRIAKWLWKACGKWWGITVTLESDCWTSFEQFRGWAKK